MTAAPTLFPPGTAARVRARLRPLTSPYATDPVGYCRQVLHVEPWSKQQEILEAVRDHRRVAVRSGHGVGKTATAALAVLWFHDTFAGSRVISTAPTFDGVKDLLWRDIRAFYSRAQPPIRSRLLDTRLERGEKWFATGISTDRPERFAGHHAEHVLYVVDEASGVDERIFEAGEGFLTSEHARVLLIGNPTQTSGQFYRAFHSERDQWKTIHVSALDVPAVAGTGPNPSGGMVTPGWVDEKRAQWGEDSAPFHIRVLGDFPRGGDDTVCALADVEGAQKRADRSNGSPVVVGCDVARFGSDETVISVRRGNRVRVVHRAVGQDTMRTVGKLLEVARELAGSGTSPASLMRIVVDDTGVGGGVTDRLREIGTFQVVAFQAGAAAWTSDYPNRRSELWFSFSQRLRELDLDPADEQLAADLVAPRYQLDSRGRRVVEAKALTKKRLGRSPDSADSVLLTFGVPDAHALAVPAAGDAITKGLMERAW